MTTETKVNRLLTALDCDRCFASKSKQTIIDVLHPATGLTWIYGKTLEDCRAEYPDAEEMTVDEFCEWKTSQQRTPITWTQTTEEQYHEMLGALPPELYIARGFLVGEPYDHDAGNGQPRFQAFRHINGVYETASRPLTRAEFRGEV